MLTDYFYDQNSEETLTFSITSASVSLNALSVNNTAHTLYGTLGNLNNQTGNITIRAADPYKTYYEQMYNFNVITNSGPSLSGTLANIT